MMKIFLMKKSVNRFKKKLISSNQRFFSRSSLTIHVKIASKITNFHRIITEKCSEVHEIVSRINLLRWKLIKRFFCLVSRFFYFIAIMQFHVDDEFLHPANLPRLIKQLHNSRAWKAIKKISLSRFSDLISLLWKIFWGNSQKVIFWGHLQWTSLKFQQQK